VEPFRVWQDVCMVGSAELSHPYDCCVYLLDAGDLVLIDCGAGRSFQKLVSNIESLGFKHGRIKTVIVTHAHVDHIGALHRFQEHGAKIIAHELDADAIEYGGGTGATAYSVHYIPCHVDIRIKGPEQSFRFPKWELRAIHIQGHTPGSIAVYVDMAGRRVLFGQDVHGPYLPQWGGDPTQAKLSLQRLIDLKADILCEGHFGIYQPAAAVEEYIREYLDNL